MTKPRTEAGYDALAARLTDPNTPLPASTNVRTGDAAAVEGRAFLLPEYGSDAAIQAAIRGPGRPKVGDAHRGPSPVVRGAISEGDFTALEEHLAATGKKQSVIVREAVHAYLVDHKLVS